MKQLLKIFLLATFIVVAAHSPALALPEPLEIVNETGQPIISLYVVPVQKRGWGNDLVGSGIMNQGDKRSIQYDSQFPNYKIKVEFADGSSCTFKSVDLLNTWRLSIWFNGTEFDLSKNARG